MKKILILSVFAIVGVTNLFPGNGFAQDNKDKIALVMKALTNPFFSTMKIGAEEYARENNITLEVFGIERETDIQRQIAIVENLISRQYGAIVIAPADSKELVPICKKALDNGIVVINIDNPFHQSTMLKYGINIPFVGSDNEQGSGLVGEYVRRKLDGKGRVFVIEGIRGVENADLRKKGFIEAITKESEITVVASEAANWHTDEAYSAVTRLLEEYGPVDAIFCANDKMALGALNALDSMDLSGKILLAGYDNIEEVRNEMRHGFIHATVEQHPELMGQYGVQMAKTALSKGEVAEYFPTPLDLITHDTFGETIGLSISTLSNPFFVTLLKNAEKAAVLHGFRLDALDARNDEAQQLADIEGLINKKISALILNPVNSQSAPIGIEMANAAGIPVITVDRGSTEGKVLSHIASNNHAGGRMAGEFLSNRLGGKGRVVELEGIPGTSAAHDRGKGFNEILSKHPDLRVISRKSANFDREQGKKAMEELLAMNVEFDAIFAHNDSMILGALEALEQGGNKDSLILIGFDGINKAVRAVEQGRLAATVAQKPDEMGSVAVKIAAQHLSGLKVDEFVPVDLKLVTQ